MSFFDDEPDEPTRVSRPARPRRAASRARPGAGAQPDMVQRRRLMLFGALAVMVILLILGVSSCSKSRHKNALKDYNRNVGALAESDGKVSTQLFDVLNSRGRASDVQGAAQQVRLLAARDVDRAKSLSVPSDMDAAQRNLELVLNLRAAAVSRIAELLPLALSSQPAARNAIRQVAGQMQAFLASDVVYSQRVAPLIEEALTDNGIHGQTIAQSKFLPSIAWLDTSQVGDHLNPDAGAGAGSTSGRPSSGTHGHGLLGVKVGTVALVPGSAVNQVRSTAGLAFDVTFANQGENDESNVTVQVKIQGSSGRPVTVKKRLNLTKAGTNATVTIQVDTAPPKGAGQITVSVLPVPGEKKTDNNSQTYIVNFT